MSLYIPILLGSTREGRFSDKAAQYVASLLSKRPDIQAEVIDARDILKDMTPADTDSEAWSAVMEKADGLIIVSPEYNHGYPASLKEVIDGGENYDQKPVAICGTSSGGMGGVRMVEQLRQVVIELGLIPTNGAVYFSNHKELWNEDGSIKEPGYEKRVNKLLDELIWFVQVLKDGRAKYEFPE